MFTKKDVSRVPLKITLGLYTTGADLFACFPHLIAYLMETGLNFQRAESLSAYILADPRVFGRHSIH